MKAFGTETLARLPLIDLIRCVVEQGDRNALEEFHEHRTVFTFDGKGRLRCAEYIDCLRVLEEVRGETAIADGAYDLTLTKFSHIPGPIATDQSATDCRKYFRPFVERMVTHRGRHPQMSSAFEDNAAAQCLQSLVAWHFHLSLLETIRHACPGMSRYAWNLPSGRISVLMPQSLAGRRRRLWLDANIPNPDARRAGENQRVQDIINRRFGPQMEALHDNTDYGDSVCTRGQHSAGNSGYEIVEDLVDSLAKEKAQRKQELSPRLRCMEDADLRTMIHLIFDELQESRGTVRLNPIPHRLGKVEFSRFAGLRWAARKTVPVLWANLAHLLASREEFVDAARTAGVWRKVEDILSRPGGKIGGNRHDR